MSTPVTINEGAFQKFMMEIDDALVSYWNKPGLATSIARSGKCPPMTITGPCRALERGVYLDEHRAVVVAQVKRFNADQTTHALRADSCNSVRPVNEITATQDFGCALQEQRSRLKHGRKAP